MICLVGTLPVAAQEEGGLEWPRSLTAGEAVITMYQPQIDSWEDNRVESRAAVSVKADADAAPVFGAVWISARFETDRDTRMVSFSEIRIPSVRFPEADEADQQKLAELLESEMPGWDLDISLDRLLPTLDLAEHDESTTNGLRHKPPKIIVSDVPAVLILIDGEPEYTDIEGSSLERVVNTPYVIVRDGRDLYLASDTGWFTSRDILGPWKPTSQLPKEVRTIDGELKKQRQEALAEAGGAPDESEAAADDRVPEIVVSTEPAELIFIDGDVEMTPVEGNDILFVANTDSDVVFELVEQRYYVLLSGRWYRSSSLDDGPWEYVANDELAETFGRIPTESDMGYLRAHVAGTEEARDALLEQSVPQTAAVKRSATDFEVNYDGEPKFDDIDGTAMRYAVNTATPVIQVQGRFYACEQAVWYHAPTPKGPWTVADEIPDEISEIPPSSPVYNVTHVHVYESTPEVVYVGYTPGYTGSYVSHGCVVYGTGWWYRPWWGHHYYARPATWGFHVRWNPWYGWSFGLSWSNGPFHLSFGWGGGYRGGWWGPGWYRPYPWRGYGAGYRAGYRAGYWHGRYHGSRPPRPTPYGGGRNIYARPANADRVAATRDRARPSSRPAATPGASNNVFTDRSGNVYRRNNDGSWDRRDQGSWSKTDGVPGRGEATRPSTRPTTPGVSRPTTPSTRPSTPSTLPSTPSTRPSSPSTRPSAPSTTRPSTRPSTPTTTRPSTRPSTGNHSMSRDYNARSRGAARSQQYHGGRSGTRRR
jgi:hypothetical protein